MKAVEFIRKYELRTAVAAGFLDHLRRDPEEDVQDEVLRNAFKEFSGIEPDRSKEVRTSEINEDEDEKLSSKA